MHRQNLFTSNFSATLIFIIKLFVFCLAAVCYMLHFMPQYTGEMLASLIDKEERARNTDEPKIVLIGNSNVAFGINSQMIEDTFNMPVVNMGLHGSLGNAFHEQMAKISVVPGDIYIICHSSFNDNDTVRDPVLTWVTIENHYRLWSLLRPKDLIPMAKAYPTYLKRCMALYITKSGNQDDGTMYARSAFDFHGDNIYPRLEGKYIFSEAVRPSNISTLAIDRINRLNQYLVSRGATLLVAGYPIGDGDLTSPKEDFEAFTEELSASLDCPVISDYTDYMFDYSYFYDTYLHLTDAGVELRTRQLILDLLEWGLR